MVSINPKITPKVSLKLPNSGNGNEGNTQETGNKVDLTGQPYNPGKSVGDLKADTLIANRGIKIGGGKPVDVEPPKADTCALDGETLQLINEIITDCVNRRRGAKGTITANDGTKYTLEIKTDSYGNVVSVIIDQA